MNDGLAVLRATVLVTAAFATFHADARRSSGPSATQYMAQRNISTACLKIGVPETGPATIVESSGDPGLDRVVLKQANADPKRRLPQSGATGPMKVLPIAYDMSEILPGGRKLCVADAEEKAFGKEQE